MADNLVESSVGWMVNCSVMLAAEPRDGWMVDTTARTTVLLKEIYWEDLKDAAKVDQTGVS